MRVGIEIVEQLQSCVISLAQYIIGKRDKDCFKEERFQLEVLSYLLPPNTNDQLDDGAIRLDIVDKGN